MSITTSFSSRPCSQSNSAAITYIPSTISSRRPSAPNSTPSPRKPSKMTSMASPRIEGAHTVSTVETMPKASTTASPSLCSRKVPASRSAEGQNALALRGAPSPHSLLIESCISRISASVSSAVAVPSASEDFFAEDFFAEVFFFVLMPSPPR